VIEDEGDIESVVNSCRFDEGGDFGWFQSHLGEHMGSRFCNNN
jgi:hypothetical protein